MEKEYVIDKEIMSLQYKIIGLTCLFLEKLKDLNPKYHLNEEIKKIAEIISILESSASYPRIVRVWQAGVTTDDLMKIEEFLKNQVDDLFRKGIPIKEEELEEMRTYTLKLLFTFKENQKENRDD